MGERMKCLLVLAGCCVVALAGIPDSSRIIGGNNAKRGSFPWMVSLRRGRGHSCGGSLIHDGQWVLTARHCVKRFVPQNLTVVVGEHVLSVEEGSEQYLPVIEIVNHPDFDAALLRLERPAEFNRYVSTLELSDQPVAIGNPITVSGWGWTKWGVSSAADKLQQIQLPVVDPEVCNPEFVNASHPYNVTHEYEFCAGYSGEVYINVCHGDSGSPAVARATRSDPWKEYGIVVWGTNWCPEIARYAVFTEVSDIYDWIMEEITRRQCLDPQESEGHHL